MLGMLPKIAAIIPPPSEAPRIIAPLAMTAAQDITAHWADPHKRSTASDVAVPMPTARPVRVAAAPARERPVIPPHPELGVDIGGALTPSGIERAMVVSEGQFRPAAGRALSGHRARPSFRPLSLPAPDRSGTERNRRGAAMRQSRPRRHRMPSGALRGAATGATPISVVAFRA